MRKILIVVDMQNDFIDGSLGSPEAAAIVGKVADKIRSYAPENVIATRDTHPRNYLDTQEGRYLPVEHCITGTEGWQINSELAQLLTGARIYDKPTFGSVEMARDLAALSAREDIEIELTGLCTDICVISNALLLKAFMPEVKIAADPSCCAGVTTESHQAALDVMRSCQIVLE